MRLFPLCPHYKYSISLYQNNKKKNYPFYRWFESHKIWAAGLVVSEHCDTPSHWRQTKSLSDWMRDEGIPGIQKVDTRALTKIIREKGTILGRIVHSLPADFKNLPAIVDPNSQNLVAKVSRVSVQ